MARFGVEYVREADAQLMDFAQRTGLHMGQWLTVPMIIAGLYLSSLRKNAVCGWSRSPEPKVSAKTFGKRELSFAQRIVRTIAAGGPMSLSHYMAQVNAYYYATRDPLGQDGDFTTAPEISQMFGEMVGLALTDIWRWSGQKAALIMWS